MGWRERREPKLGDSSVPFAPSQPAVHPFVSSLPPPLPPYSQRSPLPPPLCPAFPPPYPFPPLTLTASRCSPIAMAALGVTSLPSKVSTREAPPGPEEVVAADRPAMPDTSLKSTASESTATSMSVPGERSGREEGEGGGGEERVEWDRGI